MPIDIICSACSRVMRAPDEAAGKQVRCPHCQTINDVPLSAEVVGGNPFVSAPGGANNPYVRPPPRPVPDLGEDPAARLLLPVGRSGWAIAAGYLGLLAACPVMAPLAIIVSVIAIVHLRRNPKLHGWGRAIFGLSMGIVFSIVAIVFIVANSF
jgi:LSD1 subclass zinc finger protein